jgi:hypothetical protein
MFGLIDEMTSGGCTASDAGKFPGPPSDFSETLDLLLARLFGPAAPGRSNDNNGGRLQCRYITLRSAGDLVQCVEGLSTY